MPSVGFKEMIMAAAMNKNILLIPMLPEQLGLNDLDGFKAMGLEVANGKRKDYSRMSDKLEKFANILFVMLRDRAYIGIAWQMLVIYMNMKFV